MPDLQSFKDALSYDPETGIFSWRKPAGRGPSRAQIGDKAGSVNDSGYVLLSVDRNIYRAHRLAYEFINGSIPKGMEIDHINGVRDDNRIANLRVATRKQNGANRAKETKNKSGFKGVYKHSKGRHWVANIMVDQKTLYLGIFKSAEFAHAAYVKAANKHFGEFARAA